MDAKDHPVISVLSDQKRFMVPIYQRQYSWREPRLIPFWEDVVSKAEEALDGPPKFKHYMGALIISPGADGYTVATTPRVQIVDGQQRLTTFQLFLAAMRDVSLAIGCPEVAESVQNYVFNRPMTGDTDPTARFKLVPTPEDRTIFHEIIDSGLVGIRDIHPDFFYNNGRLIWGRAPNSVRALQFFSTKIEDYARFGLTEPDSAPPSAPDDESLQRKRMHALLEALLRHLKLVVITLDETDDAQVIFETLNSKAEPLLAMDLVRNNIFHRAEQQGEQAEILFQTKWRPLDAPFWKEDSPRAKPRRPRIDHFLSHALTAQTGEETSLRELYSEYRAFARPKGKLRFETVESELDALLRFAPTYRTLEMQEGNAPLAVLGRKLATWEVATAYPLIFCVETSDAPEEDKAEIYSLVYSYIVRRAICGLTPKNLNKNFQRMVAYLLRHGVSVRAFADSFTGQIGPTVRFPDDNELRTAVTTTPLYRTILRSERLQDILWELEVETRTIFNVNNPRPDQMSVEHILPQSWQANWPLPDGRSAPGDKTTGTDEVMARAITLRDAMLHTLGNLTLMTGPGNIAASNRAFSGKKDWLRQSLLAINFEISEHDTWGEDAIAARARLLGERAITIWPAPLAAPAVSTAA